MRRGIQWALLDTKPGDLIVKLFEQTMGLGLVKLEEIEDVRVAATLKGNAAAKVRAPAKG